MKRFVIASVLFVATVASSLFLNFFLERRIDFVSETNEKLLSAVANEKDADASALIEEWEKSSVIFSALFAHCEFSDTEEKIFSLPSLLDAGLKDEAKKACIEIKEQLKSLRNSCGLTVSNLL